MQGQGRVRCYVEQQTKKLGREDDSRLTVIQEDLLLKELGAEARVGSDRRRSGEDRAFQMWEPEIRGRG